MLLAVAGAGLCGRPAAMKTFAVCGFRTIAFAFRGYPPSDSPRSFTKLDDRAGAAGKRAVVYPGTYNGWDLLDLAPQRACVWATLRAWLRDRGG